MSGIFVIGVVQMGILILSSFLLFGLKWGSAAGVVLLTLALVAAATGWGMLLAAYCRTPAQAGQLGALLSLVFAMCAGNLVPRVYMPEWLRTISLITPNAWGLEGYTKLGAGAGLQDIGYIIFALLVMSLVLIALSTLMFRRQYA
jgi:ABC-2 type transport system permease protein